MTITKKQLHRLWGDGGPYSQAKLIIETRILDDKVSRVFLVVEIEINPLTYEIVKKHRSRFKDNPAILHFLDHADYRGEEFGYVIPVFQAQYRDKKVMTEAKRQLRYATRDVIKIHKFVMELLNLKPHEE